MAVTDTVKRPLMPGQYVWACSKKDGKFRTIVGPDALDATEDEIFLVPDVRDPTKVCPVETATQAIRDFVTLAPDKYAVLYNPSEALTPEYPNGPYSSGRGDMKALKYGIKRVACSGRFPLWPGQKVEVRDVHTLSANQYLMVVVESENVDTAAPYYQLTLQCAAIKVAVVADASKIKESEQDQVVVSKPEESVMPAQKLVVGQRIIIPGSLTPTYIPPSGIEVVPDETTKLVVREAVVSGPTEFCVLIDEEGQPQPKKGPGRVFPGPNDRFMDKGSRNRVYDAYHIRNDRGLLLRVVADKISADELKKQLPSGTKLDDQKAVYTKGDEIFVGGSDSYLVPSTAFEVIDPETRQPHIGNDHSKVYIKAIGVDQKSGVYIANVSTGNVELKRGEVKLLLDPRKEKHVLRRIPGRMWNLMIAAGEQHKKVADTAMVETPWALSVVIPNNEAVLITSKSGRRCVVGPCTELLEFEEWFEVLTLSRGRPKSDDRQLETCFLRVKGNRISDSVELETEDFATIIVDLSYGVEFVGDDEERIKWFDYKDYVMLLCANLRSRLRNASKKYKLTDLYPIVADFVRDNVLGKKAEGEEHRPGLLFKENNMEVQEVEVLSVRIPDDSVAIGLEKANREVVTLQITDSAIVAQLASERKRDIIAAERDDLKKHQLARQKELELLKITDENEVSRMRDELLQKLRIKQAEDERRFKTTIEEMQSSLAEIARTRRVSDEEANREMRALSRDAIVKFRRDLASVQEALITASASADVDRLKAIQPKLIEAIEGLGDKQLATSLAQHLPDATGSLGLLLGEGGIKALKKMVEGTPIEAALNALADSAQKVLDASTKLAGKTDPEDLE